MSTNDPILLKVYNEVEKIIDQVYNGSATGSRKRKNERIQAVIVDPVEIYEEISGEFSPFMWPEGRYSSSERKNIAKKIQKDLWIIYTTKLTGVSRYTKGKEAEFIADTGAAIYAEPSTKIIYIKNPGTTDIFKYVGSLNLQIERSLSSRSSDDFTKIFWNPDKKYFDEYNKLEIELNEIVAALNYPDTTEGNKRKRKFKENMRSGRTKSSTLSQKYFKLKEDYPQNVRGVNAGHGFGAQLSVSTPLFQGDASDLQLEHVQLAPSIEQHLQSRAAGIALSVFELVTVDANMRVERRITRNGIFGEVSILLPELDKANKVSGTRAQNAFKKLKVKLKGAREDLVRMKGSPSVVDLTEEFIESKFLEKPIRTRKLPSIVKKSKTKSKRKKIKVQAATLKGSRVKVTKTTTRYKRKGGSFNLPRILDILNDRLHDAIERNMGKGRSKKILNYQTGRFAKSAEVKMLYPSKEKNAINAKVKYMKKPYDVFEPGGRLATGPGRSPALIFGKSIRQILIEERIAVLRRVKVDLT